MGPSRGQPPRGRGGRRRDRHGRGMRGPLAPARVPVSRSRAQQFDDLVLDAVEHLDDRWQDRLDGVQFAVEDVPDPRAVEEGRLLHGEVPLGRVLPANRGRPARVVVYRRPVELRAPDRLTLAELVHDVVVEQVAQLLGVEPNVVDPAYGDPGDEDDEDG